MPDIYKSFENFARRSAERSVDEILDYCKPKGMPVYVENLPSNCRDPLFNRPEEFNIFLKNGAGMLLDTAHSMLSGINPTYFLERLGEGIKEIHLVDAISGKEDVHYPLCEGELDYIKFLNLAAERCPEARIILEMKSEDDVIKSLDYLKEAGFI